MRIIKLERSLSLKQKTENRIAIRYMAVALIIGISACDGQKEVEERERPRENLGPALNAWTEHEKAIPIHLDPAITYQVMDNFGASDCWSAQFVGNWPDAKKQEMADWLFSKDTASTGQPEGIGLSAWRFNIGAGSTEQEDQSQIGDEWRRAECFLNSNGSYNWDKQAGQQWFLKAAKQRGVEQFIGFANSPPVYYTKSGLAHGKVPDPENLAEEAIPDYARFLLEVARGLKQKTGVEFTYLSPFNEPQWDWTDSNQEGCHMRNSDGRELVRQLNQELESATDLNTRILISEAGEWDYLYEKGNSTGNQIDYFFGGDHNPLKDASRLERVITGHSYYTTHPASVLVGKRESVWNKVSEYPGLRVWSTEYCPLGSADLQNLGWSNWRKDHSMHVALYVANILHHDLVYTRASAWQWWLAISNSDYPDGLIYVNGGKSDGTYSDSKLLWTLGNFSRFIEPGSIRIQAGCEDKDLLVTAFYNDIQEQLTLVLLNTSEEKKIATFETQGINLRQLRPYITSDQEEHNLYPLEHLDANYAFEIPASCAITFTASIH
jgi:O-glycosyl hydrolase